MPKHKDKLSLLQKGDLEDTADIKEPNQLIDGDKLNSNGSNNTITQEVGPPCNVTSSFLEESIYNTTNESPIIHTVSTPCMRDISDTINTILSISSNHYGIRGKANDWFNSYLTNRKQYVSINGFKSDEKVMNFGCPTRVCTWASIILNIYKRHSYCIKISQNSSFCG